MNALTLAGQTTRPYRVYTPDGQQVLAAVLDDSSEDVLLLLCNSHLAVIAMVTVAPTYDLVETTEPLMPSVSLSVFGAGRDISLLLEQGSQRAEITFQPGRVKVVRGATPLSPEFVMLLNGMLHHSIL